jgi:DNA end-binding protein Ku
MESVVAPRAYWKGYLKLSLVSCPVALFPASSEREKISFHQINKKTGNRIKYRKVDAETGDEVDSPDIVKGYEVGKGEYVEIEPEELEAIAVESKRTIEIDQFVPKKEIDELYLNSPYYIVPDGEVGQQAFAVIREAIRKEGMVTLARVVFTSREHVMALEPRGKGLRRTCISTTSKMKRFRRTWRIWRRTSLKPRLGISSPKSLRTTMRRR